MSFKLPGTVYSIMEDFRKPLFKLYTDPPPGCVVDTSAPEPRIPVMLYDVGVDKLIEMIEITPNSYDMRIDVVIDQDLIGVLSYSQLYQLQCNMLWTLREFTGSVMSSQLEFQIKDALRALVMWMIKVEIRPGDFGAGVIKPNSVGADDFDLEDWE
jgi:hypothetical protein